jgi:FixJ family two-component response regulator
MEMPGMTGLELQNHLTATGTRIPTIFITANPDEMVRAHTLKAGALYLEKPFDDEVLLTAIRLALNVKPRWVNKRGKSRGDCQPEVWGEAQ